MKIHKGYKYQLRPKPKQLEHLNQSLGCNRFVWNKLLALNLSRLNARHPILWYKEMAWMITLWKKSDEYAFLKLAPSQSLQYTAKTLARAFSDAFDKKQPNKRLPKFKKRNQNEAGIRYPQGFSVDEGNQVVSLPKIGHVKYRNSRTIEGTAKNVTLSRKAGAYTLSIQAEQEIEQPIHPSAKAIALDMGVNNFAALSNGDFIKGSNSFKQLSEKLAKEQRKLAKKVKFSANWHKQKEKVAKLQIRIAAIRLDFLHKTSTWISKNHAMIAIEDLRISNMTKSAKGTVDEPGRNVAQKSGLNRVILDQGWGEFRRQLDYKQAWLGGWLIAVSPHHTSQCCPACGHVSKDNRKTQAAFVCVSCGYANHADTVGAMNVLAKANSLLAGKITQKNEITAGQAGLACEVSDAVKVASSRNHLSPLG